MGHSRRWSACALVLRRWTQVGDLALTAQVTDPARAETAAWAETPAETLGMAPAGTMQPVNGPAQWAEAIWAATEVGPSTAAGTPATMRSCPSPSLPTGLSLQRTPSA